MDIAEKTQDEDGEDEQGACFHAESNTVKPDIRPGGAAT
jgi:hypothetical protein